MSGALNGLFVDFKYRQGVRHAMFDHLGIAVSETEAQRQFENLRAAMLACNRCAAPQNCRSWIDHGHRGAPQFCKARTALRALQRASDRAARMQHADE